LENEGRTTILFESPHRLLSTLEALRETVGDRKLVIARELTKLHEEILRGTAEEILQSGLAQRIKGEVTIVIEGKSGKKRKAPRIQSVD
jgi:16S rRNA (cytidine1402-2'-O)-methyltransferase